MILFLFYPGQSSTLRRWEGGGRAAECDELTRRQQRGELLLSPLLPPPAPGSPLYKEDLFKHLSPPTSSNNNFYSRGSYCWNSCCWTTIGGLVGVWVCRSSLKHVSDILASGRTGQQLAGRGQVEWHSANMGQEL